MNKKIEELNELDKKVVLAPMAGITDGDFCKKFKDLFAIVTIGGYNLDTATYKASKEIEKRGRKEFSINLEEFNNYIIEQIKKARESNALVSVNVRFVDIDEAYDKLLTIAKHADVIELNCHCRQKEITSLGIGQELMKNKNLLKEFLTKMKELNKPIFLKIRLNYIPLKELIDNLNYVRDYFDGLHVDCFYPGKPYADLNSLKTLAEEFSDKVIIGNNSIDSLEKAKEMLRYSDFVSVARTVLKGNVKWIKELNERDI
ncbi:TIM-barrel protein [Methanocaldococcus bathoardescens]|uniref:TIM-barrel protein n=1 Tax=Methanocaldococcus bathoardescens TaxID=1301915 RepID=A0A076LH56_9EURY|nr:MJ0144 family RNA dihydrouridine synthase-like protein [Methanocaldococcus bathoardescens]AIJ04864.1 TIM-barrel protein [Methanocaldococcus bathoardescens]